VAGFREMARVRRSGGVVTACVWDFADGSPIGPFWDAAQALDPEVETGSVCPGSRAGHLADLFRAAGIGDIVDSAVAVDVEHATFEDWWEPFTLGVAPSGALVAGLEPDRRTALRELCRERLPEPPFVVSAKAWVARGAAAPPRSPSRRREGPGPCRGRGVACCRRRPHPWQRLPGSNTSFMADDTFAD